MTWQHSNRPPLWGVRLEQNHRAVNILVLNLGQLVYMRSFKKRTPGVKGRKP